ncbi:hypothetical protein FPY71_10065 [Aureimonas fodinaquatilis]|uniref:Phage neck terminator protein gp12-like domain-containing protein n=1 Tax=Aureimonas fodinaquatilis TaxID=2565783 RepID=A0A5B0DYH0_9HYPH|nr:hypothetical protein [Aureimonas fodinaquatilis]KAA0970811.1 hypothetical protein FPY71_10065 [Aureimonas fodinaquatilis]
MTEKEVRDALQRWLFSIMGVTVIHTYQGGTEPAEPYGVLNLTMSDALHPHAIVDEFRQIDDQAYQAPVRDWYWRFSINVYGPEAATILRRVKTAEKIETATAPIRPLIVHETSQIRDATELLNEEWQTRAQMDIEIRGIHRDALPIDTIEEYSFSVDRA